MPPNTADLFPDAAQRIMNLVQQAFGPRGELINFYSLGLPDDFKIVEAAFPCVIVDKTAGTYSITGAPTSTDSVTEMVYIHILVNVKTGFGAPNDDNTVKRQLQTWVEGRDPTTGYLKSNTLMYALRRYISLSTQNTPGFVPLNNDVHVSYDAPKRPNMPSTRECIIDVTVKERQVILGRDQP